MLLSQLLLLVLPFLRLPVKACGLCLLGAKRLLVNPRLAGDVPIPGPHAGPPNPALAEGLWRCQQLQLSIRAWQAMLLSQVLLLVLPFLRLLKACGHCLVGI